MIIYSAKKKKKKFRNIFTVSVHKTQFKLPELFEKKNIRIPKNVQP